MRALRSLALAVMLASACGTVTSTGDGGGQGGSGAAGGGGTGTGGAAGSATGGTTGTNCAQLESAYANELKKAKSCSPNSGGQCQQMAPNALECSCPTFVNDRSNLDQIQQRWTQNGCAPTTNCPAVACVTPRAAICTPGDGGNPTCNDVSVAAP